MGFISFSFKIMWKPNGLSQSFEILHEQMVGYTVGTRFNDPEGTRDFWSLNPNVVKSNF